MMEASVRAGRKLRGATAWVGRKAQNICAPVGRTAHNVTEWVGGKAQDIYTPVSRTAQDALLLWHESRDRRDKRQQHADIRRKRMSCADSLQDFQKTQDWTGQMSMSPSGKFRVVEDSRKREPLVTREGLRWSFGWSVLTAAAVLMAVMLLADVIMIGNSSSAIDRLNRRIDMFDRENSQLSSQLSYSSGDISVCTEAVKLNLISSSGAMTVKLTAPQSASLTFAGTAQGNAASSAGPRIASIMGD